MKVNSTIINDTLVIEIEGEINGQTAPAVQRQVLAEAADNSRLLLDMSKVTYMSSAGLRMMLMVHRQVESKNGQVTLVGMSEEIHDTMEMTGFLDFFDVQESVDAAVATLPAT